MFPPKIARFFFLLQIFVLINRETCLFCCKIMVLSGGDNIKHISNRIKSTLFDLRKMYRIKDIRFILTVCFLFFFYTSKKWFSVFIEPVHNFKRMQFLLFFYKVLIMHIFDLQFQQNEIFCTILIYKPQILTVFKQKSIFFI